MLGRVQEVGEITNCDVMTDLIAKDAPTYYVDWLYTNSTTSTATVRTEVVRTMYDGYANPTATEAELGNVDLYSVRNRIGTVFYQENYNTSSSVYDYAIHYSYDVNACPSVTK